MLCFKAVGVHSDALKTFYYIPDDATVKEKNVIKYFFSNIYSKGANAIEEDLFYFIYLEHSAVIFKITPDRNLTGIIIPENMIIYSWLSMIKIIVWLKYTTFAEIEKLNQIDLEKIDTDIRYELLGILKRKYKDKFTPVSFISGRYSNSFFGLEKDSIDLPMADFISYNHGARKPEQKKCIPSTDEVSAPVLNEEYYIRYIPAKNSKGIFSKFKNKKERETDFIEETYVQSDSSNHLIKDAAGVYKIYDDAEANLFRLDSLMNQSGEGK